jgi:hypothetical protein
MNENLPWQLVVRAIPTDQRCATCGQAAVTYSVECGSSGYQFSGCPRCAAAHVERWRRDVEARTVH